MKIFVFRLISKKWKFPKNNIRKYCQNSGKLNYLKREKRNKINLKFEKYIKNNKKIEKNCKKIKNIVKNCKKSKNKNIVKYCKITII